MLQGHRIFTHRDAGGWRQFLEDKPLHAGDALEMLIGGHWISGRYESNIHEKRGLFYTRRCDPEGREEAVISIDPSAMRFRRPSALNDHDDMDARLALAIRQAQAGRQALRDIRAAAERGTTIEGQDNGSVAYEDRVYWSAEEGPEEAARQRYWVLRDILDEARVGLGY